MIFYGFLRTVRSMISIIHTNSVNQSITIKGCMILGNILFTSMNTNGLQIILVVTIKFTISNCYIEARYFFLPTGRF